MYFNFKKDSPAQYMTCCLLWLALHSSPPETYGKYR